MNNGFPFKYRAAWEALEIGANVAWGGPKSARTGVVVWKQPDAPMGYPVPYPSLRPAISDDCEALGAEGCHVTPWSLRRDTPSALVRDDKRNRRGHPVYRMVKIAHLRPVEGGR